MGLSALSLLESGSSLVLLTLNSATLRLPEVLLIAAWAVMRDALLSAAWTWQRDRLELSFLVSCAYFTVWARLALQYSSSLGFRAWARRFDSNYSLAMDEVNLNSWRYGNWNEVSTR